MIDIKEIVELYGNLSLDTVVKCFAVYILINMETKDSKHLDFGFVPKNKKISKIYIVIHIN